MAVCYLDKPPITLILPPPFFKYSSLGEFRLPQINAHKPTRII